MRCFIGLQLPEDYQNAMDKIRQDWQFNLTSKIAWTKKGNWHLTLFFLGDVQEQTIEELKQNLSTIKMHNFKMQAGGGGFFPPGKKPRVLWTGVKEGANQCISLAAKIESVAVNMGFRPNKKYFKPHLTLARIKEAKADNWSEFVTYLNELKWSLFIVQNFVIWKSRLTPKGPIYCVLKKFKFS